MSKIFKKIGKILYAIFESFIGFIDKIIIMPISRLVYNINKKTNSNNSLFSKLINRPRFLIVLSLIFAVIIFLLIDNKVISLVDDEAESIENVPVNLIYNDEAFVVENVPSSIDITVAGRKVDVYLAKQLGEFQVELNLSKYTEAGAYKVYFTYSKNINSVKYLLNPAYLTVNIKDKVSEVKTVEYDIVGKDALDPKLSIEKVTLDTSEVVVKGSQDTLNKISSIKALVDVSDKTYTEAGTYELTNIPLVAYDNNGEVIKNVEIVPKTLTGSLILNSYKTTVPVTVSTIGSLVSGRAISSITINNSANYSVDVYGDEEAIKNITSIPVQVLIDGLGNDASVKKEAAIKKTSGVRYLSAKNVTVTIAFGNEEQKTIDIENITQRNLPDGYTAGITSNIKIPVQVKGVLSNIEAIEAKDINAYVDLSGLGEGTHEVEVKIDNNNPLVNYVVSKTITIKISKN